jgi:hypothetical protein
MSPLMPLNSTCSRVSGTRHDFSGRVCSWSVNLRDSCGNCAVLHPVIRNSGSYSKHNKMMEAGLLHTTPHQTLRRKGSYGPAGNP